MQPYANPEAAPKVLKGLLAGLGRAFVGTGFGRPRPPEVAAPSTYGPNLSMRKNLGYLGFKKLGLRAWGPSPILRVFSLTAFQAQDPRPLELRMEAANGDVVPSR